jgi:Raf kinase inhibitor-like YbhB/YbcL family protein
MKVQDNFTTSSLGISCPEFRDNTLMPRKYACQGDNINPPLEISGIPKDAKSLVLIMDDPDAIGGWDHWIVWNIPITTYIGEDSLPERAVQGTNSFGDITYGGPCPPSGTHRYHFRIYAIDRMLELGEGAVRSELEIAMKGHVLAESQLIGIYRKS